MATTITIIDPTTGDTLRTIDDPMRRTVIGTVIRYEIARQIVCPFRGYVMDVRTCVAIIGPDDTVLSVMSPEGWSEVARARWDRLMAIPKYSGAGVTSARKASLR